MAWMLIIFTLPEVRLTAPNTRNYFQIVFLQLSYHDVRGNFHVANGWDVRIVCFTVRPLAIRPFRWVLSLCAIGSSDILFLLICGRVRSWGPLVWFVCPLTRPRACAKPYVHPHACNSPHMVFVHHICLLFYPYTNWVSELRIVSLQPCEDFSTVSLAVALVSCVRL